MLAGCTVTWSIAASESGGDAVLHLPSCATGSVANVRVVDEASAEIVWEIATAEPGREVREFVVGESTPGFAVVVPMASNLVEGHQYHARVRFAGSPGPVAEVYFTTADLASDSWWFDGHVGTPASFESAARGTGLCGASEFSFRNIFWTKFGLGCLVVLFVLAGLVGRSIIRRRRVPVRRSP